MQFYISVNIDLAPFGRYDDLKVKHWHFPHQPWFDAVARGDSVRVSRWTLPCRKLGGISDSEDLVILAWIV